MIENVPSQVFDGMMDRESASDMQFLRGRYKTKSRNDTLKLIPKVLKMKREKMQLWKISFATGLSTAVCRSIIDRTFLEPKAQKEKKKSPKGFFFLGEVEEVFDKNVADMVEKKKMPFHNIRANGGRGKKASFNIMDITIAYSFYDGYVDIGSLDGFSGLDSTEKGRVRYRVSKSNLNVRGTSHLIDKIFIPDVLDIIEHSDEVSYTGKKRGRKQKEALS